MRIILTGCGAPGTKGTIYCIKNNYDNENVFILGVDCNKDSIGKYLCDDFKLINHAEHPEYIKNIATLYVENDIDLIVPQTTKEVEVLSKHKEYLNRLGINMLVDNYETIKLYNNKYELLNLFKNAGLPYSEFYKVNNKVDLIRKANILGYPQKDIVIKPVIGNGSRGVRIITDKKQSYYDFLNDKPDSMKITLTNLLDILPYSFDDFLLCEYLSGKEYTVDCCNLPVKGAYNRSIICRTRDVVRSGISFKSKVVLNYHIPEQIDSMLDFYSLYGVFGFQFKENKNGIPIIIECNPRIQGTMVASFFAGYNIIWDVIRYKIYKKIPIYHEFKEVTLNRYWGSICNNIII